MTEQKMVNGVDVGKLVSTVESVQGEASLAKCKFRLSNKWVNGGHNQSVVGEFCGAGEEHSHLKIFRIPVLKVMNPITLVQQQQVQMLF